MAANGRRYSIFGQRACAAAAPQHIINLTATAAVRPFIYDILIGSSATPADNAILWQAQRNTASGTGTTSTAPTAIDSGDPAITTTSTQNHTTDPTTTANTVLWYLALNQRASHRWIADPNGTLIAPATANNGIGLWLNHASFTGNCNALFHLGE